MTLPVLLDCDPGNDDALGILVAAGHADIDLKAVTTGAGHLAGDRTAHNGAIALHIADRPDVPISKGAMLPLVRERLIAGILDMDSALDPERPELPARALDARHSVDLIIDLVMSDQVGTIVTTGPLTNLALALRKEPKIAGRLERLVILGGSVGLGNKTAAAEWNILCDPEAAAIVFGAGVPMTLIPVDGACEVGISPELIARTEAIGGTVGAFAAELLRSLVVTFRPGVFSPPFMPLNDPVATLVAADLSLARTVPARVDIELAGTHTYGRSVIDIAMRNGLPANADVVLSLHVARVEQSFIDALTRLATTSSTNKE